MQKYSILKLTSLNTLVVKKWDTAIVQKVRLDCELTSDERALLIQATPTAALSADIEADGVCDDRFVFHAKKISNIALAVTTGVDDMGKRPVKRRIRSFVFEDSGKK